MSVNGKRQNITRDDFLSVAKQMNIKKAPNIIDQINSVVQNWNQYAEEGKVTPELADAIQKTLINVDH